MLFLQGNNECEMLFLQGNGDTIDWITSLFYP